MSLRASRRLGSLIGVGLIADFMVGWVGRLVLVDDVDEAGAVGESEDVGGQGETGEEGEEEFHGLGGWGLGLLNEVSKDFGVGHVGNELDEPDLLGDGGDVDHRTLLVVAVLSLGLEALGADKGGRLACHLADFGNRLGKCLLVDGFVNDSVDMVGDGGLMDFHLVAVVAEEADMSATTLAVVVGVANQLAVQQDVGGEGVRLFAHAGEVLEGADRDEVEVDGGVGLGGHVCCGYAIEL